MRVSRTIRFDASGEQVFRARGPQAVGRSWVALAFAVADPALLTGWDLKPDDVGVEGVIGLTWLRLRHAPAVYNH